jgi:NADPH-dependent curcumin reductase CurA
VCIGVVGGEILDLALSRAKPFARFVQCGAISEYNSKKPQGLKVRPSIPSHHTSIGKPNSNTSPQNYMMLISMRIRMQGFVVFDFADKYTEARKQLAQWLSEGKLKRKETIVKGGILKAEEALVGLFEGKNTGKWLLCWLVLSGIVLMMHRQNDGRGSKARRCEG